MKLTTDQQEVIAHLAAAQERFAQSDNVFAHEHLGCSGSKWNRIKDGTYWDLVDDIPRVIAQLRADLGRLNLEYSLRQRFEDRALIETDSVKGVRKALGQCEGKPLSDPDRCVVFLAPTGGGKTFLCSHLRQEANSREHILVEAREVWKRSYYYCVRDLCIAAGVPVSDTNSPAALEQRLLEKLAGDRFTILIDEAEYFGPQALNLIKLILNKTRTVILLAVIPEAYEKWNRSASHEASQVRRRTHRVIRVVNCEYEVVENLFAGTKLNGLAESAVKLIASRCSRKTGHYDLARLMANRVISQKCSSVPEIERALAEVELGHGL
jgi:hypothetical protein